MIPTRLAPGEKIALWGPQDGPILDKVESEPCVSHCNKCSLGARHAATTRCIRPLVRKREGPSLLVIGGPPVLFSHEKNEGFLGAVWRELRSRINAEWAGTVVFDHAIKCATGGDKPGESEYRACRPYLARSAEFFEYDRMLVLGREAAKAVLGRSVDVDSMDLTHAWSDAFDCPIGVLQSPMAIARNRYLLDKLYGDISAYLSMPRMKAPRNRCAVARRYKPGLEHQIYAWADGAPELAIDIETEGRLFDHDFRIISLAIAREASDLVWVWDNVDLDIGSPGAEVVCDILSEDRRIVAHNLNYEVQGLHRQLGLVLRDGYCTLNTYKLHRPYARAALESLQELVGAGGSKAEMKTELKSARTTVKEEELARIKLSEADVAAEVKRSAAMKNPDAYAYGKVNQRLLLKYNARDALTTAWVREWIRDNTPRRVDSLWDDHVHKTSRVCSYMERTGLVCDRFYARDLQKRLADSIALTGVQLCDVLARDGISISNLNVDSSKQLADLLYTHYALPVPWLTEAQAPSTDKFALKKLAAEGSEVAALMLTRRRLSTLAKTYAWSFDRFIQDDGRIHPVLKPYGTETGRLSGSDPNPQNLPRGDDEEGKMVKNLIIAPKGRVLAVFDHSTLEIRVAAGLSQDPVMLATLEAGLDIHLETAKIISPIFNVDATTLTKSHWLRSAAKTIYFALLYGKGDESAAEDLNIAVDMAASVRSAILGANVRLASWIAETEAGVRRNGGVWISRPGVEMSRFRPLPWIHSSSPSERNKALRQAVNTKVQGFGAEINNCGMIACHDWIMQGNRRKHIAMPLTVHDSLVFECDEAALDEVLETVPRLMTAFEIGAPLAVDAAVGHRFGDVKNVSLKG